MQTHRLFRAAVRAAALVATLAAAAACSVRQIGQAQEAFNAAATIEATAPAPLVPGDDTLVAQRAESSYRVARALVAAEIAGHEADLRSDGLLGVAYTLKALCEWRLADLGGDLGMAESSRQTVAEAEARSAADLALGTRDRVVLSALPGVADIVRARLSTQPYRAPIGARACIDSAITTLDAALAAADGPPADHPVRVWVRLSQLKACQQWFASSGALAGAEMDAERAEIRQTWERCARELASFYPGNEALRAEVRRLGKQTVIPKETLDAILGPVGALPAAPTLRDVADQASRIRLSSWINSLHR